VAKQRALCQAHSVGNRRGRDLGRVLLGCQINHGLHCGRTPIFGGQVLGALTHDSDSM